MTNSVFAGVDVGGTNIKAGLVDDSGRILARSRFATQQERGAEFALQQVTEVIEELLVSTGLTYEQLMSIGMVVPGPLDIPAGRVLTPFNLPAWGEFPVRDRLSELTRRDVTFGNDAGAAAFGEYWIGRGQQFASLILITLGTGVGGGIIIDNQSIDGAHSHGSEIGHLIVDIAADARLCSCGRPGHLEAYASGKALVSRCVDQLENSNVDSVLRSGSGQTEPLSALMISEAAAAGDRFAEMLVDDTARYLGIGIASLAHIIDPEVILLGGAVNFGGPESDLGIRFLDQIRREFKNRSLPKIAEQLTIDFATLGSDAGFVGAAGMARREYRNTAPQTSA